MPRRLRNLDSSEETPTQGRPWRRVNLSNPSQCRKLLSRLINDTLADELPESKLKSVTYSLNTMLRILETSDLESRLEEIERMLNNGTTERTNPQRRASA